MNLFIEFGLFVQLFQHVSAIQSITHAHELFAKANSSHESLTSSNSSYDSSCTHVVPPSIFYIGLPHVGSSSMSRQMHRHPSMSYGSWKEHRFWAAPGGYVMPYEKGKRSVAEYYSEFAIPCEKTVSFDATPFYLYLGQESAATNCTDCPDMTNGFSGSMQYRFPRTPPGIAGVEDVAKVVGKDAKFLVMFRDPMAVAAGHYPNGDVNQPCHACDADSVETWLKVFPNKNFFFIDSDEYFADQQKVMDEVFKWVGVEPFELDETLLDPAPYGRRRAISGYNDSEARKFHSDPEHQKCRERLESMTGLKFNWLHAH